MKAGVRVAVDSAVCALSGYCEQLAGDLFQLDDDGLTVPEQLIVDPECISTLLEAEAVCPTGALSVTRADA